MKLLRVGGVGAEKPAMLAPDGSVRDLSAVIADFGADALSAAGLDRLRAIDPMTLPVASGRIGPCVPRPVNFVRIGLNYADHAAETGAAIPKEPIVFLKSLGALCGPNDDVLLPRGSTKTDWEVELCIVIGTRASYVPEHDAMAHVAGYCIVNDVSEREYQLERGGTWDKGKGCDTFGPTGPWLVTRDEVPDVQALAMFLDVWAAHADRDDSHDDLRRAEDRELREPLHDAPPRRPHQHRDAAGRGAGAQAAGVPAGRADDAARD